MKKGQVSVEYLVIVGFALGILVPGIFFFYKYTQTAEATSTSSQLNQIGLETIGLVRSTYGLGRNSRQTMEFVMPEAVVRAYVHPLDAEELVFEYETRNGMSEAVFFSPNIPMSTPEQVDGNISNSTHVGLTKYRFQSYGTSVEIMEAVS